MKVAFAPILYMIVLLFHFSPVRTKNLQINVADYQLPVMTPCNFTSDCVHLENSACVEDYCECNGSKFCPSQMNKKVLKLGQSCDDTSDCLIESSVCAEGICKCIEGAVKSMDEGRCLEDQLNTTETCSDGCQCKTGYVLNGAYSACLKIVETLKSACDEDVQCFTKIENSICHQGFCECIERHRYNANENMCTKDSSSDVASEDETNGHVSAGCADGICNQQNAEVQVSNADEACIGSLCDDFKKEQQNKCTVGRCECPEEKQFCTNGDRNRKREGSSSYLLHRRDEQFGRYGGAELDTKAPVENYLYQSILEVVRKSQKCFKLNGHTFSFIFSVFLVICVLMTIFIYGTPEIQLYFIAFSISVSMFTYIQYILLGYQLFDLSASLFSIMLMLTYGSIIFYIYTFFTNKLGIYHVRLE